MLKPRQRETEMLDCEHMRSLWQSHCVSPRRKRCVTCQLLQHRSNIDRSSHYSLKQLKKVLRYQLRRVLLN